MADDPLVQLIADADAEGCRHEYDASVCYGCIASTLRANPETVANAVLVRYQEQNHDDGSFDEPYWELPDDKEPG